ncbi:MAG TPA: response regulator transcription factor [Burkholderiales bacterium]|nr:response regulator transcription factor [Burkholderiales bacterium]
MRILAVEDDPKSSAYLTRGLAESGHIVDSAADGATGLAMAREGIYDCLIVDRRLPKLDGLSLVRSLREGGNRTPVLMLSALASTAQRVEGLQAGCDDYLAKPYAFVELLARLEALLRSRGQSPAARVLEFEDLRLDLEGRIASRGGKSIALQHREFLILQKLMRHAGEVVTRSMLLEAAWDYDFDPRDNVVDKHVHRLRRKIDEGFPNALIRTVAGAGYMMSILG